MNEVKQHINSKEQNPLVTLTDSAYDHIMQYLIKHNKKGLRLSVKRSGCSGMSYVLDYPEEFSAEDFILPLADQYSIYIDKNSYPYIKDLKIDYIKEGLNHKFVFNNPNQTGQCGCGESFTIE